MTTRRRFVQVCSFGMILSPSLAATAADAKVSVTDPMAVSVGYVLDVANVDKVRFPGYVPSQSCGACKSYLGKPTALWGECVTFKNKLVPSNGWCSVFTPH